MENSTCGLWTFTQSLLEWMELRDTHSHTVIETRKAQLSRHVNWQLSTVQETPVKVKAGKTLCWSQAFSWQPQIDTGRQHRNPMLWIVEARSTATTVNVVVQALQLPTSRATESNHQCKELKKNSCPLVPSAQLHSPSRKPLSHAQAWRGETYITRGGRVVWQTKLVNKLVKEPGVWPSVL